jgi:uncharacterized protein (TIGR03083 family)
LRTENDVASDPSDWISAWRTSQGILAAAAGPLDAEQLDQPSYDSEWSIAEVLSHVGSQAEIFELLLSAGLSGGDPPGQEDFAPIWQRWNARAPQAQATDALAVNEALLERFESLDDDERERFHLNTWGMDLDLAGLASLRAGEHAVHTWDVVVMLDPTATVAPDAVDLLVDTLDRVAGRAKPDGQKRRIEVATSAPERHFTLETGDSVRLVAFEPDDYEAELRLPAEAFLRLLYGRLDPAHTPPLEARGVDLDELRAVFPGF